MPEKRKNMEKILIMGADKEVPRFLFERLGHMGVKCRAAFHNTQSVNSSDYKENVERISFDFSDMLSIKKALRNISSLFLVTPDRKELVSYVKSVTDLARESSVKQVVFISLLGADISYSGRIGAWYLEAENIVRNSSIPFTILRSNCLMQKVVSFVEPRTGMIYLPLGEAKVSLVDARDVAAVAADIFLPGAHHFSKTYNLTGNDALTMHKVAESLSQVTGREIGYVDIPEDTAADTLKKNYSPEKTELMLEYFRFLSSGQGSLLSSAEEIVSGIEPISFIDFARDYAEILRSRLAAAA